MTSWIIGKERDGSGGIIEGHFYLFVLYFVLLFPTNRTCTDHCLCQTAPNIHLWRRALITVSVFSKSKSPSQYRGGGYLLPPEEMDPRLLSPLLVTNNSNHSPQTTMAATYSTPNAKPQQPTKPLLKKTAAPVVRNVPISVNKGYSAPPSLSQYPMPAVAPSQGYRRGVIDGYAAHANNVPSSYPDYPRAFRETSA